MANKIMIKIIYYNQEIDKQIKEIDFDEKFDFDYRGQAKTNISKTRFSFWDSFFSKRIPIGAPAVEGLIPFLIDGLNIVRDVSWELTKGILIHELIKLYEAVPTKKVQDTDKLITANKLIKEDKKILQIITDQNIGEAGELTANETSISFVFTESLTGEQINRAYLGIDKVRSKIKELLRVATLENVGRIECIYKNNNWNIKFISYYETNNK